MPKRTRKSPPKETAAVVKTRTPAELLEFVRAQRKRADGLYSEHATLSPRLRLLLGMPPAVVCDQAYRAALAAAEADIATYRTLPPARGAEPLADLNNLELWVLSVTRGGESASRPRENMSLQAQAIAIRLEHPDWTNRTIARTLGLNPKTLSKPSWSEFIAVSKRAKQNLRMTIPHGSKDGQTGEIEAIED